MLLRAPLCSARARRTYSRTPALSLHFSCRAYVHRTLAALLFETRARYGVRQDAAILIKLLTLYSGVLLLLANLIAIVVIRACLVQHYVLHHLLAGLLLLLAQRSTTIAYRGCRERGACGCINCTAVARVRRPARGLDGMPDGSFTVAAVDDGSAAAATRLSNRTPTTISAAPWCSQCVVRCHPRGASATSLIVALQNGGAFCHGSAAGFDFDVATTCIMIKL